MPRETRPQAPRALADLIDIATYIGQHSPRAATRFIDAAESMVRVLGRSPMIGKLRDHLRDPRLAGVRSIAIRGFPNHLMFYHVTLEAVTSSA